MDSFIIGLRKQVQKEIVIFAKNQGLTLHELSKKLDLPQPRISELVNGKIHLISLEKLLSLYKRLGGTYSIKLGQVNIRALRAKRKAK